MRIYGARPWAAALSIFITTAAWPYSAWAQYAAKARAAGLPSQVGRITPAHIQAIAAVQLRQALSLPPLGGVAGIRDIAQAPKPKTLDAVAEQAAARALLSVIVERSAFPAAARPAIPAGLAADLGEENADKIADLADRITALSADKQVKKLLRQARSGLGRYDTMGAMRQGLTRLFDGSASVAPDLVVPAQGLAWHEVKLKGARFADSVIADMARMDRPFSLRIDRAEFLTLGQKMYHGSSFKYHDTGEAFGLDLPVVWGQDAGLDQALYDWLLQQPARSVTPEAFFLKAVELAQGSVWQGLAAGWDVLVVGSQSGDPQRQYFQKSLKLADIRGDLHLLSILHDPTDPRHVWTSRADNFSAWYHFWGTMTYSFFRSSSFFLLPVPGKWFVTFLVLCEELIASILDRVSGWDWPALLDLPKRLRMDMEGVSAGCRLAKGLRTLFRQQAANSRS
ncbi:MAG: hypothetical protein WC881_08795 [Elusimicrobiota bacterium]